MGQSEKKIDAETVKFLEEIIAMRQQGTGPSVPNVRGGIQPALAKKGLHPRSFDLAPNYPNPFNPSTTIEYQLPADGNVTLSVFDVLGRQIVELASGVQPAGYYSIRWDASSVASGIYYARFIVADELGRVQFAKVNKLLLMK